MFGHNLRGINRTEGEIGMREIWYEEDWNLEMRV